MVELLTVGVRPCVPQEMLILPGEVPMTFSFVPPGSFLMGLNVNAPDRNLQKVTLTKGFYLGVYSVTQAQWNSVMGTAPSHFKGDDRPVEMVSWDDCQEFCGRLSRHLKGRVEVRLPTATEWEWACRAGTTTWHYVGEAEYEREAETAAWFDSNSGGETHPVGQLLPNAWGLYDMTGNVWQWCDDWWGHYSPEHRVDPIAPAGDVSRVYRGGGWGGPAGFCGTNSRSGNVPETRCNFVGLRVCFNPT
jgi:formylglycine-generating enzyme required for sulfatase activity